MEKPEACVCTATEFRPARKIELKAQYHAMKGWIRDEKKKKREHAERVRRKAAKRNKSVTANRLQQSEDESVGESGS
jgi:hypothetical protein